jgi:predicted phage tail protein
MEGAMNAPAAIGHNNPPDPLDDALAPYGDAIEEAQNWLDGATVEDDAQMKSVDALLRDIKAAEKAVTEAQKDEAKPLHDAWKAALARYKPTLDDLARIKKGLVAAVDGFKRRVAAEKAEAERKARAEAEAKMRAAAEASAKADAANLEAQREAARMRDEAEAAKAAAHKAKNETVKGLRTVTRYEITDHRALLHWIAKNDRDAITAFVEDYARRNHKSIDADGLRVWQEREAF